MSAKQIPRWVSAYGNSQMIEEPTGNYVHLHDHEEALAEKDAIIQQLRDDLLTGHHAYYQQVWNGALDAARDALGSTRFMNVADGQIAMDAITKVLDGSRTSR